MRFLQNHSGKQWILISCSLVFSLLARGLSADDSGIEFFENKIRPVLVKHCYQCHSSASDDVKGEFKLDDKASLHKGGESGSALVPFKPEESLLLEALRYESFEMPPEKKLPDDVIDDFAKWIKMGAPDPRDKPMTREEAAEHSRQAIFEQRRQWWSLLPLENHQPPETVNQQWSDDPIDQFILSGLEKKGLAPAPDADAHTLLRRLSFVLKGLPPSVDQVDEFTAHYASNPKQAFTSLVVELLDSPHYGERMARHWMDVVRYTDTYGYEWDNPAKGSWEYRDYLIRAFNKDVSFRQLVLEQIAGDLLAEPRINPEEGINESLIGPMFYHMGEHRHGDSLDFNGIHQEMINNKIDAFSKAFLANSVACARCHDHKLDAVWQKDYYALAGVFMSPRWTSRVIDTPEKNKQSIERLKVLRTEIQKELKREWKKQAEEYEAEILSAISNQDSPEKISLERLRKWINLFQFKSELVLEEDKKTSKPIPETTFEKQVLSPARKIAQQDKDQFVENLWNELAGEWKKTNQAHREFNEKNFKVLADFTQPEFPEGWTIEGDGLEHGYVSNGTLLISLDGEKIIDRVLVQGYHTNALSSKLPGALRLPPESQMPGTSVNLELAGGEWSGFLRIPDNAFQTENVIFLNSNQPKWHGFVDTPLKNGVQRKTIEIATSDLNPNFPPRTGKATAGGVTLPENDEGFHKRSWFSITGIVSPLQSGTPKDEQNELKGLYEKPVPKTKEEAFRNIAQWLSQSVVNWTEDKANASDVMILNGLLKNGLLQNKPNTGSRLEQLIREYREVENQIPYPRTVNSMDEREVAAVNYPLNVRGNVDETGPEIPRDFLEVFEGQHQVQQSQGSGRLELANFMVSPNHPLTARVYVNRVWQWIFGEGIVRTPNDYGHLGIQPTHPELLDYLANRFVNEGWSTKKLIRQLVLSRTFRQSGEISEKGIEVDPDNFYLHYYPTRRLEAEAIRDSFLSVSGELDETLYGHPVNPPRTKEDPAKRLFSGPLTGNNRRSIYIKMSIMDPPKFLVGFNLPDLKLSTGKRDVTNVPTQALILLNDPFVVKMAEKWTERLLNTHHSSVEERLQTMFQKAYGRPATSEEIARWNRLVEELNSLEPQENLLRNRSAWYHVAHTIFNTKEFLYYR